MASVHLWVRAEQRAHEQRVGITPEGAAALIEAGMRVTVEHSADRAIPMAEYADAGVETAPAGSWPDAPRDAVIFGLKELPDDGTPLAHRHLFFGHAFKGQHAGRRLLSRFRRGGGTLYDLEYLVDDAGRRVAAMGYWAGYVGAAVALKAWAAQARGGICGPVDVFPDRAALNAGVARELDAAGAGRPAALVIGALGRVGTGASDLCRALGAAVTQWDMAETAHGGPYPEILEHDVFLNCILAGPETPVFVPRSALGSARRLTVIGDIACDPDSDYNPVPVYTHVTSWEAPVVRVHEAPPLDVMAIDNLPSMLPRESSEDFAAQLLPTLLSLGDPDAGVWRRAQAEYEKHVGAADAVNQVQ